ncbi:MAG: serine/threonine protein kinase [Steroidobacteraceae bacterium]
MPESPHPYSALTPDVVIEAVEALGHRCDGRVLALNSYENRVYQVGREDDVPVVAKFYRPARWTTPAILEEHEFALELARAEVPVVAPQVHDGRTLFERDGFRYAVYARQGGRWPELATKDERMWMGRFLARIHAIGGTRPFRHRATLDWRVLGEETADYLLDEGWIPSHIENAYVTLVEDLLGIVEQRFAEVTPYRRLRLHGDCHPGNVLWTDDGPHFVDLDDCMMGPAMQDLWMLLSGRSEEMSMQLGDLLEGYGEFADFDYREIALIEPLRTLRIMHYAGWLARRWDDPAFPRAFPWFEEPKYWEQHVLDLREQLAAMEEEPLAL